MDKTKILEAIDSLASKKIDGMYLDDFLLTWDKTDDEIAAVFLTAEILRAMRRNNISCRVFDSGLAVAIFRDKSTRTRYSFAGACDLLGLAVQDLDEEKSQIAHGETVRETANMVAFLSEVIGIRDDMYLGAGHTYMQEVSRSVHQGYQEGVLPGRPAVVTYRSVACTTNGEAACNPCDDMLALASAVERRSQHPLALAVQDEAIARGLNHVYAAASGVTTLTGKGVTGEVNGRQILVGSHSFFEESTAHPQDHCLRYTGAFSVQRRAPDQLRRGAGHRPSAAGRDARSRNLP